MLARSSLVVTLHNPFQLSVEQLKVYTGPWAEGREQKPALGRLSHRRIGCNVIAQPLYRHCTTTRLPSTPRRVSQLLTRRLFTALSMTVSLE